jgi:hypothetical protein
MQHLIEQNQEKPRTDRKVGHYKPKRKAPASEGGRYKTTLHYLFCGALKVVSVTRNNFSKFPVPASSLASATAESAVRSS